MKIFINEKLNKERGSATIEAIISFTGFLFVIFTILNVVNFCRAQMLISNAVDTATKEITQYSYFYKMSGLQKFSEGISNNAEDGKTNLNDVLGTVDGLYSSIGTAIDNTTQHATNVQNAIDDGNFNLTSIQNTLAGIKSDGTNIETSMNSVMSAFDSVQDNPLLYMKSIIAVAGNESLDMLKSHVIAAPLAKSFTAKHFGKTTAEANDFLKGLGVVDGLDGMNFKMSTIFSSDAPEDIHIVVYYRLKIVQIFGWATVEVPMCKESVARAWLGGDDVQKVVEPVVPATEIEDIEVPEKDVVENKENEEQKEEVSAENVDISNSLWHLGVDEVGYDNTWASFDNLFVTSKGINREELVVSGILYGRDKYNVAYGMDYCPDADDVHPNLIFYDSIESIKAMEKLYVESNGSRGYEPGSTNIYKYIIYVPENISDEKINKIANAVEEGRRTFSLLAEKEFGTDISVSVEIVKAGGNYDYGSEEKNE